MAVTQVPLFLASSIRPGIRLDILTITKNKESAADGQPPDK